MWRKIGKWLVATVCVVVILWSLVVITLNLLGKAIVFTSGPA